MMISKVTIKKEQGLINLGEIPAPKFELRESAFVISRNRKIIMIKIMSIVVKVHVESSMKGLTYQHDTRYFSEENVEYSEHRLFKNWHEAAAIVTKYEEKICRQKENILLKRLENLEKESDFIKQQLTLINGESTKI